MSSTRPLALFVLSDPWMQEVTRQNAPPEFEVAFLEDMDDEAAAQALLPQADFLMTVELPARWLSLLKRCRLVQLRGVGYDGIAREGLAEVGIPLAATPEGTVVGVAEHTILLILALYKQLVPVHESLRGGEFDSLRWRARCHTIHGKAVGIVGFGRIGRRVAHLAHAFGARILYTDVVRASGEIEEEMAAACLPLEPLLRQADVVSVHLPLTPASSGLFDAEAFARMKPGALFINTSRGGTYELDALYHALRSEHLGGAGLDVFAPEPPPPNHPLLQLPNVVCTPHMATGTVEAHHEKAQAQFENFRRVLRGEPPQNLVLSSVAVD